MERHTELHVVPGGGAAISRQPSHSSDRNVAQQRGIPTPHTNHTGGMGGQPDTSSHAGSVSRSLYQCADCQRRYSRPEHLARHIQTHTLGKRFKCEHCGKAFARADLLKRHAKNHEDDGEDSTRKKRRTASSSHGRVSHACKSCAGARVRCEETKPCSRCKARNIECEYTSSDAGVAAEHLMYLAQGQMASPRRDDDLSHTPQMQVFVEMTSPGLTNQNGQLATPETLVQAAEPFLGHVNHLDQQFPPEHDLNFAPNVPFSDFLRDVLTLEPYDQSRIEEFPHGHSILNFCDDSNVELNDIDINLLNYYNNGETVPFALPDAALQKDSNGVDMTEMCQRVTEIWQESPWRWAPTGQDHAACEQTHLTVPSGVKASGKLLDRVVHGKLSQSSRDKMMATVLSTCRSSKTLIRAAASFPPADVLDDLINLFLASQFHMDSSSVHFGSLSLNQQYPEWLCCAAASGAVLTSVPTLRRFGFAIQEVLRTAIVVCWEENNSLTREVTYVQAWMVQSDIALWSGNRRKMELANSHSQAPITMLRAAGRYKRSAYPLITVDHSDEGKKLEEKWQTWAVQESWKRLAYHSFVRDEQASMTNMVNPVMTYAELTLPLPCHRDIWLAKNAHQWKTAYLSYSSPSERPPTLHDVLRDVSILTSQRHKIDLQLSASIYLHAIWGMIWEYRQMETVHRSWSPSTGLQTTSSLVLSSRHQELRQLLLQFQLTSLEWTNTPLNPQLSMILDLMLMNLHVSLDDVQLFVGREGEQEAKKIYPTLQTWVESRDARQAVWHAAQILRAATAFQRNHLKDFYAVAVHHACLCIWTYGVVLRAKQRERRHSIHSIHSINSMHSTHSMHNPQQQQQQQQQQQPPHLEPVYLNGTETHETQRFIVANRGTPMLRARRQSANPPPPSGTRNGSGDATLEDPRACMEIGYEILKANFAGDGDLLPPIVENLCQLIKQLGNAAWTVGLG